MAILTSHFFLNFAFKTLFKPVSAFLPFSISVQRYGIFATLRKILNNFKVIFQSRSSSTRNFSRRRCNSCKSRSTVSTC